MIVYLLGLIGILWVGITIYIYTSSFNFLGKEEEETEDKSESGCTEDLRICPDGTAVFRSGPNCVFSECPEEEEIIDGTIEIKSQGGWGSHRSYLIHSNGTVFFKSGGMNQDDTEITKNLPPSVVNEIFIKSRQLWNESETEIDKSPLAYDGSYSVIILTRDNGTKTLQLPGFRITGNTEAGKFNSFLNPILLEYVHDSVLGDPISGERIVGHPSIVIEDEQISCTKDAKSCQDGSFVSRVPPNCEFAPCPSDNQVMCAQDVRQCPHGYVPEFVSRQPPNCEFAPCRKAKGQV